MYSDLFPNISRRIPLNCTGVYFAVNYNPQPTIFRRIFPFWKRFYRNFRYIWSSFQGTLNMGMSQEILASVKLMWKYFQCIPWIISKYFPETPICIVLQIYMHSRRKFYVLPGLEYIRNVKLGITRKTLYLFQRRNTAKQRILAGTLWIYKSQ